MSTPVTTEGTFTGTSWEEAPYSEIAGGPKLAHVRVTNTYEGAVSGTSILEYLLMYLREDFGTYIGYERIDGEVAGKRGTFCLSHEGTFDDQGVGGLVTIVEGSGTGELTTLRGSGTLSASHGQKNAPISFTYEFGEEP